MMYFLPTHVAHHDVPAFHANLSAICLVNLVVIYALDDGVEAGEGFADGAQLLHLVGVGQLRPRAFTHAWTKGGISIS